MDLVPCENRFFLAASIPVLPPTMESEKSDLYWSLRAIDNLRFALLELTPLVLKRGALIVAGDKAVKDLIQGIARSLDDNASLFGEPFVGYEKRVFLHTEVGEGDYKAGFFLGGMEDVERAYGYFCNRHSPDLAFPVATTGSAARRLFDANLAHFSSELKQNLQESTSYGTLFNNLLDTLSGIVPVNSVKQEYRKPALSNNKKPVISSSPLPNQAGIS
ncbi:MAG: hypothetical protein HQL56_11260 [Magnetococcales bacterium]|nr:hypothetical protein [Magnetococcales bacterium]